MVFWNGMLLCITENMFWAEMELLLAMHMHAAALAEHKHKLPSHVQESNHKW